jgi:hypothetical protein
MLEVESDVEVIAVDSQEHGWPAPHGHEPGESKGHTAAHRLSVVPAEFPDIALQTSGAEDVEGGCEVGTAVVGGGEAGAAVVGPAVGGAVVDGRAEVVGTLLEGPAAKQLATMLYAEARSFTHDKMQRVCVAKPRSNKSRLQPGMTRLVILYQAATERQPYDAFWKNALPLNKASAS